MHLICDHYAFKVILAQNVPLYTECIHTKLTQILSEKRAVFVFVTEEGAMKERCTYVYICTSYLHVFHNHDCEQSGIHTDRLSHTCTHACTHTHTHEHTSTYVYVHTYNHTSFLYSTYVCNIVPKTMTIYGVFYLLVMTSNELSFVCLAEVLVTSHLLQRELHCWCYSSLPHVSLHSASFSSTAFLCDTI